MMFRALFLALMVAGAWIPRAAEVVVSPLAIGASLPEFSLPGVDGKVYTEDSFKKAAILAIVFTCNHCPTAQAYEDRLISLVKDFKPRGVEIVAINPNSPDGVRADELGYTDVDDTLESMKIRAAQKQFNFPYLDDGPSGVFSKKIGPAATPHVFIFDSQRKLRYQGRIDDSERPELIKTRDVRDVLTALLESREPKVTATKVLGCSTKWDFKKEANQRWLAKVHSEPVKLETVNVDGLKQLRKNGEGKVRVVNFWATWCGPCVSEFDELMDTNLRFRQRDFELVTVAAEFPDERAKVEKFLNRHHASCRNLIFGDNDKYKLIEAFDPEWSGALPHTVILDPQGKILFRQTGEIDFLELRRKIVPALNQISPWPGMK